ncbi:MULTISPECIES: helix-turn-helix domain-containing protein [unclassified Microbacterium]|uniref:helix-turn-helix domain-containing protein n=1 Tax=unclassified Microbacterium TaxID=2609290 RepID=UPI0010F5DB25|nr:MULTISPECIES: helix-turn-helix domain-containing protein [unclassified Microbacterium]
MGFKTTEWAYGLSLVGAEKEVLQALAHRADDNSRSTFVGRSVIASMTGRDVRTVSRAFKSLEAKGIILREERRRKDGYRDTDMMTINTSWDESQGTQCQGTQDHLTEDQVTPDPISGDMPSDLRGHSVKASSKELVIHDQPEVIDTYEADFGRFWSAWPRKVKKPYAFRAWLKAIKRAAPEQIIDAALAYRDNPGRPEMKYIPHPASWLNADSWNDELEDSRERSGKPTPTERAQATLQAGLNVAQRRQTFGNVTTLNPKGITA